MTAPGAETSPAGRGRFVGFLDLISRALDDGAGEGGGMPCAIGQAFRSLLAEDDWLDDEFARSDPDRYQQYLLYCDARRRFSVVSFVWGPGQSTPIHDHRVWGMVGMLRGSEVSENFQMRDGRLVKTSEDVLTPGQVISFTPEGGDIHRVRNAYADRTSVSIHIYGGDIGSIERSVLGPDGERKPFISGYANRRLPNFWGVA
jgi:3-mercaptopropionate dioxygenase